MLAEEEDSSSLELGEDGVTDPPPTDLPGGADDEGRLDMDGNSGTHFSSRSTTIPNQRGIAVKSSVEGAAKTWAAQQKSRRTQMRVYSKSKCVPNKTLE